MKKLYLLVAVLAAFTLGCEDNVPSPAPVAAFLPPTGLKALSVNQTTVSLQWTAAGGSGDSTFAGYVVQVGGQRDTLGKATTSFIADSLPPGESEFHVSSLRVDGVRSDAAVIRWAPATRFDSTYLVYENASPVSVRPEGFNVGTTTTNPSVMPIDLNDPMVEQTMDLFFNGDSVETRQSLSMWSAHLRLATLSRTFFSTQTNGSPSLDFPLAQFPPENTFTKDSIAVVDNTIYYAKVVGDPLQVNFARLHLHIRPGTSVPNRIIEVRVSLQRVPGLLYALVPEDNQYIPLMRLIAPWRPRPVWHNASSSS